MDSLAVSQGDDAQVSRLLFARPNDHTPKSYPLVRLDFTTERASHHVGTPLPFDVGSLAHHLLFKVSRRLHSGVSIGQGDNPQHRPAPGIRLPISETEVSLGT